MNKKTSNRINLFLKLASGHEEFCNRCGEPWHMGGCWQEEIKDPDMAKQMLDEACQSIIEAATADQFEKDYHANIKKAIEKYNLSYNLAKNLKVL